MTRIRVVTDSAADLDKASGRRPRCEASVHLDVRLGDFGPDVTSTWSPQEFWKRSAEIVQLPETSGTVARAFKETFSALADDGAEGIVCVTLSSKACPRPTRPLSSGPRAWPVGSESVSSTRCWRRWPRGSSCSDAVTAAEAGGDLEAVAAAAMASRDRVGLYGAIDSLDNLRKADRLGRAQALLAVFSK